MTILNFNAPNLISGTAEASRQILYAGRTYHVLALGWQTTRNGRGQGHVTRFLPRDAMLAWYMLSSSVRPSQAGIVQKRQNIGSRK